MALPIPINDPTSGVRLATRAYPELQGNDLEELPSDAAFEQVIPGDTNTANVVSLVQLLIASSPNTTSLPCSELSGRRSGSMGLVTISKPAL
jgi:hypothetical protein